MQAEHYHQNNRIALGLILIIIGILFFLKTIGFIFFSVFHLVFSFPFIVFAIGLIILINSRKKLFGIFLTLVGTLMLIPEVFPSVVIDSNIIFAVFIIGVGLAIIFKKRDYKYIHSHYRKEDINSDFIDDVSIFSGGHKTIIAENFKGGNITAIFGGSKIDLTNCKLAEGNNILDVVTIFGGTSLIVPKDWNVNINVMPIFGGFSSKIRKDPSEPVDMTRSLTIKGVSIFGGGEIKSSQGYYQGY